MFLFFVGLAGFNKGRVVGENEILLTIAGVCIAIKPTAEKEKHGEHAEGAFEKPAGGFADEKILHA